MAAILAFFRHRLHVIYPAAAVPCRQYSEKVFKGIDCAVLFRIYRKGEIKACFHIIHNHCTVWGCVVEGIGLKLVRNNVGSQRVGNVFPLCLGFYIVYIYGIGCELWQHGKISVGIHRCNTVGYYFEGVKAICAVGILNGKAAVAVGIKGCCRCSKNRCCTKQHNCAEQ